MQNKPGREPSLNFLDKNYQPQERAIAAATSENVFERAFERYFPLQFVNGGYLEKL